MAAFSGTLNQNEIYSALYNMIISQDVFDRISDSEELVDKAKVDGSLYGDTKLYYAADALASSAWGNDSEATNLLSLDRPDDPECQAITLNTFRQIRLTLDDYLSKRAWGDEGSFSAFNSLMEGMIGKTKRIYDVTTYSSFIGNDEVAAQNVTVTLPAGSTAEEEAKLIAKQVADTMVEMTKVSRDYNEYGHITKFSEDELQFVWNAAFVNKIKKVDLPTIFHKDGLMDKFEENVLPPSYFGRTPVAGTDIDSVTYKAATGVVIRARHEMLVGTDHYFAGDQFDAATTFGAGKDVAIADAYVETDDVICKIYVKLPPYMSAFEVGTSFFNPRSLTTNRYLTWGHNTLEHLKAFPVVTIKEAQGV